MSREPSLFPIRSLVLSRIACGGRLCCDRIAARLAGFRAEDLVLDLEDLDVVLLEQVCVPIGHLDAPMPGHQTELLVGYPAPTDRVKEVAT